MLPLVALILLHLPGGHPVAVNPVEITSMRAKGSGEHFHAQAHCLVNLTDGKFVAVTETCEEVAKQAGKGLSQ